VKISKREQNITNHLGTNNFLKRISSIGNIYSGCASASKGKTIKYGIQTRRATKNIELNLKLNVEAL
tara:strand:- start:2061 stop:2261 length:201 start_codon:yes stop_codon:yes gene_type:complete